MIPLHDDIPPRHTPFVTYVLLAITSVAFIWQLTSRGQDDEIVERHGVVPARLLGDDSSDARLVRVDVVAVEAGSTREIRQVQRKVLPSAYGDLMTLFTCMFLHGGWMHFLGNMWFLHIFGDNVEDRFGHFLYLVLYLGGGIAASAAHIAADPSSTIPTIGASGAIAAVMGAYVLLYPHAKVQTIIPLPILFFGSFAVPAPIFLGVWFLTQLYSGTIGQLGGAGGVAWWAHIGGFVAGFVVALLLKSLKIADPPVPKEQRHRHLFGDPRF